MGERRALPLPHLFPRATPLFGRTSAIRLFACICVSVRWRFPAFRVERRDGFAVDRSSAYAAFFAVRTDASPRAPRRSVALTPAADVSTGASRRRRGALFDFFGPDRSVQ
jgi:hypothetical protein